MRLLQRVPFTSRPTFKYDMNAAWLYGIQLGIIMQAIAFARKYLNATDTEVALILAAPAAGMLWSIYWGHLASNRRKMPFFFWPAMIGRGMVILAAFASNSLSFTIVMLVAYSISMLTAPVRAGIIRANYPDDCRGLIVGRVRATLFLTGAVAAFLAGRFMDRYIEHAHWLFVAAGVAGMVSAAVFSRIKVRREQWLDNHVPERFSLVKTFGVLFSNPKFGVFQLLFSASAFATHMARMVVILYLTDVLKVTYTQYAVAMQFLPRIFVVLTTLVAGMYIDRWNPMLIRGAFVMIGCASPLIIYFSDSIMPVYGAMVLWGIALGGGGIVWAVGSMYFAPERQVPAYQGVHTSLTGIRGILGPFVGVGLLKLIGMNVLVLASVIQVICGVALLIIGIKEQNKENGNEGETPVHS
ncbi:MAG: MFS transporter [Planctomycetes bacterium]|nr:MFS transporter [Planctomycetota bacterium]